MRYRLTGASSPLGGGQWERKDDDREFARGSVPTWTTLRSVQNSPGNYDCCNGCFVTSSMKSALPVKADT